ncbi:hypothetical protein [Bacteroides sp. 519]|uniref:DUF7336 domain-containing protein n=1 Tax=Bacteroides sp. 519 TaxID=2302937 RepID=UPI00194033E6|nr:hypothetical protein [Bacteroides sp. 519]
MKERNGFYVLDFVFDVDDDNYVCIERYAFIGIFSTKENANNAIDDLINKPGFKDHPRECFYIRFYGLNELKEWMTGFVKL